MRKRPLIGILAASVVPKNYVDSNLPIDADFLVFGKKGINWSEGTIDGWLYSSTSWSRASMRFPDVVFVRRYSKSSRLTNKLEQFIGKGRVFNQVTRFDKWVIYNTLLKSSIKPYLPLTRPFSASSIEQLLKVCPQVVVKPRKGCLGRGVHLLEKNPLKGLLLYDQELNQPQQFSNLTGVVNAFSRQGSLNELIVQRYIDIAEWKGRKFDLRVIVQKDRAGNWQVTGGFTRVARKRFYVTNIGPRVCSLGCVIRPTELDKVVLISKLAAQTLDTSFCHLGEVGVDMCVDRTGALKIIEVNGRPQKFPFNYLKDPEMRRRVQTTPLEYAYHLATL